MIVFGGRSNMTEFDAEILPGREGVQFILYLKHSQQCGITFGLSKKPADSQKLSMSA